MNKYTQWDNVNARGEAHLQHLKQKLPAPVFAKFERAEAAHKNSVENFPLFAAAIGAGLLAEKVAKQDVGNAQFAGTWLAIRTLYTLLYVSRSASIACGALSLFMCADCVYRSTQNHSNGVLLAQQHSLVAWDFASGKFTKQQLPWLDSFQRLQFNKLSLYTTCLMSYMS